MERDRKSMHERLNEAVLNGGQTSFTSDLNYLSDFAEALRCMRAGQRVYRRSWIKIQFVVMMPELYLPPHNAQTDGAKVNDRTAKFIGEETPLQSQPYFSSFDKFNNWQPGWCPSVEDILADDWMLYDEPV